MDRRSFLRSTSLALAGGLVVGDAALELFERLTHRKVWALGAMPGPTHITIDIPWGIADHELRLLIQRSYHNAVESSARDFGVRPIRVETVWGPTFTTRRPD